MINARQKKSIDLAIRLARKFKFDGDCKLASVLTKGSQIVSIGQNWMKKSHPKSNHPYRFIHSELDAIIGIPQETLYNSTLFIARVGFDNRSKVLLSRPCIYCQALLARAFVKDCFFTIQDERIGHWNIRENIWSEIT